MSGSSTPAWSIGGDGPLADDLRRTSRFVSTTVPITVATDSSTDRVDAFAIGTAALETSSERVVPLESAFEAVESVRDIVASGEVGRIYGCFVSVRLPRGSSPADVVSDGLLPAVAVTLDTIPGAVERVWAKRASLFAPDDAWFVTLRLADNTLLTVEAMAAELAQRDRNILLEVTSSERVLRAEPTRQAIMIETLTGSPVPAPWWEDLSERYLHLVTRRASLAVGHDGTRLRSTWSAIMSSADSGQPVTLQ